MKAAHLLSKSGLENDVDLKERIASSLYACGFYEKAGELYQDANLIEKAMDSFKRGKAYNSAVELARKSYPQEVTMLEEEWGDYLVSSRHLDASINHFIESGNMSKAIDAAIGCKQWKKAVSILDSVQNVESMKKYIIPIAEHFAEMEDYVNAERFYLQAKRPNDAVMMYTRAREWELAHKVATTFMSQKEIWDIYVAQAKAFESKSQFKDAERLYITIKEHDMAINMYKNNRQFDQMISLVKTYHKDLLGIFSFIKTSGYTSIPR